MAFGVSSSSKTTSSSQSAGGPVTASAGTAISFQSGTHTQANVLENSTQVLGNQNLGGYTFGNIGEGAEIKIIQEAGDGASATNALEALIRGQADTTAAALGSLGNLNARPVALPASDFPGDQILTWSAAAGAAAILLAAIAFIFRR